MAQTVWKFPVPDTAGSFEIEAPLLTTVVSVALQDGKPHFWAATVPGMGPVKTWKFEATYTGNPVGDNHDYKGSVVMDEGRKVIHYWVDMDAMTEEYLNNPGMLARERELFSL